VLWCWEWVLVDQLLLSEKFLGPWHKWAERTLCSVWPYMKVYRTFWQRD
jgi:hypothetical protein